MEIVFNKCSNLSQPGKKTFTTPLLLSAYSLSVLVLLSYNIPTLKLFSLLPNPWVDPSADWLCCEWCVYGEGFGPRHYSTQILILLTALSALGLHVCIMCMCGCSWVCLACISVCQCVFMCVWKHFAAVHVAIHLSLCRLQYTLLVSIKYLSHADCPPVLCLYNVHLYAAWDHFSNGQPFHVDQRWHV